MKKLLTVIIAFILAFTSLNFIIHSEAEAKTKSFLMDRTKKYKLGFYSYYKEKRFSEYVVLHYEKNYKGYTGWDNKEHSYDYNDSQDKKNYYIGGGFGGGYIVPRNGKVGQKIYYNGSASKYYVGKISSIKATVKTKAGSFKNCTVIKNGKAMDIYAPNNGLIKRTDEQGKIVREVVKITKR